MNHTRFFLLCCLVVSFLSQSSSRTLVVGNNHPYIKIKDALASAKNGDSIIITKGHYSEGNIVVNKQISLIGKGLPIIDGNKKYEVFSIKSDFVKLIGLQIQRSGSGTLDDPAGIKVYNSKNVLISNNVLYDNFFGIYLLYCNKCIIKNNKVIAFAKNEQMTGNGIHCFKSDSLQIIGNQLSGNRDGIYFEFVTHSIIWRNKSHENIRYGLHFMFSNNDAYISNTFRKNGVGVAVMFTNNVIMMNNIFKENWGDAAYGLLLKEISDCFMAGNKIMNNTTGVFMDGTNRIKMEKNSIAENGWGLKIQANCMDNTISKNNFIGNTFDIGTNGSLTLNNISENYWDKYEGYDLDRDDFGDLPYHPLSLYSYIVESNPPAMLLFRSFMVTLLDKSEKIIPSLTPDNFIDLKPLMHSLKL